MKTSPRTTVGWWGEITTENCEEVALRIQELLEGKFYSFAWADRTGVSLHTSQKINRVKATIDQQKGASWATLFISDAYGNHYISIGDVEVAPIIEFNPNLLGFKVTQVNILGETIYWEVRLEDHNE